MAKTTLTLTTTARTGVAPTVETPDEVEGNQFTNDQATVFRFYNGDAAAHVVVVPTTRTVDGKAVKDQVVSVPASGIRYFGPYSNANYGTSGIVTVLVYNASGPTFDSDDAISGGTLSGTSCTIETIKLGTVG